MVRWKFLSSFLASLLVYNDSFCSPDTRRRASTAFSQSALQAAVSKRAPLRHDVNTAYEKDETLDKQPHDNDVLSGHQGSADGEEEQEIGVYPLENEGYEKEEDKNNSTQISICPLEQSAEFKGSLIDKQGK